MINFNKSILLLKYLKQNAKNRNNMLYVTFYGLNLVDKLIITKNYYNIKV